MRSLPQIQDRDTSADEAQARKMRQYVEDTFPKDLWFLIASNSGNWLLLKEPDTNGLKDGYSWIHKIYLCSFDAEKEIQEWIKLATRNKFDDWFHAGWIDELVARNLMGSRHRHKQDRGHALMERVNQALSQQRRER